ncbi:hypothetical protein G3I45_01870, partial [Streptomyces sp. SID339]|nr:hypothetical protein [Streptomyces sp. SID339]
MTGQPASDAELDEALALVNGHRDAYNGHDAHEDPVHRPTSAPAQAAPAQTA